MLGTCRRSRSRCAFDLEAVEPRRHFSVVTWVSDVLSDLSDVYFADVQMGSDGNPTGYATGIAGVGDTQRIWSYTTWDPNLSDGLDSGWRLITFALNNKSNGSLTFKVGTGSLQTFNAGSSITVNSLTMRAAVQGANMELDWRSISVNFYAGTSIVETDTL